MKSINNYISEKLQISSKGTRYNYHPKDKYELREILEELMKERGENANLNDIDVSEIEDMGGFEFKDNNVFESGLFYNLDPQNIDISLWDVSNVKDMKGMFVDCYSFNCDLSKWDVSNVENMAGLFFNCHGFDSDLGSWDVSKVEDMGTMFFECTKFKGKGLENWDVSNVKDMRDMFSDCESFNCDLNSWDISNVTEINNIFYGCKSLKEKPDWYLTNTKIK